MKLKRKQIINIFILLLIISIGLYILLQTKSSTREYFNSNQFSLNDIDYYVITMGQANRLQNIKTQLDKLNSQLPTAGTSIELHHIDAVNGDDLDLNELVSIGKIPRQVLTDPVYHGFMPGEKMNRRKYEIGCYMSHLKTLEEIKKSPKKYSIVFEDDFEIKDGFYSTLQQSMNYILQDQPDFDMILLGINGPGVRSKVLNNSVYQFSCDPVELHNKCYGSHAYLIPQEKADKIHGMIDHIDDLIDTTILRMGEENRIKLLQIYPDIVTQNSPTTGSIIR